MRCVLPVLVWLQASAARAATLGDNSPRGGHLVQRSSPNDRHLTSMTNTSPRVHRNGLRHFAASALSGAAGVTALAPIEVIRLNMMVNKEMSFKGALRSLEGGWFRGNTPDTISAAFKVGITMPAFAMYKRLLTSAAGRWNGREDCEPTPRWAVFVAGALAGCTATIITFPLDVARTRMAMECPLDMNVATCLYGIGQTEGLGALYRGLTASCLGVLPYSCMKLATYDLLRRHATGGVDARSVSLPMAQSATFGAVAGVVAATSCFPLEVIRRRQMMGEFASLSTPAAIRALVQAEGTQALFKGVGLNIAKVALANALGFALYEICKDALAVDDRKPPWKR